MSTKIYTAYRLKKSKDLWPFVRDARRKGVANIREELATLFMSAVDHVDEASEKYQSLIADGYAPRQARFSIAERHIIESYREQSTKSTRDLFDFDVSITVREHQGHLYLIPHCDMLMRHVLDFLADDPRLEDFSYWNNTDQPEGISNKAWAKRGKIWNALDQRYPPEPPAEDFETAFSRPLYFSGWLDYVVIEICSVSGFWQITPFLEIQTKEAIARKKAETLTS